MRRPQELRHQPSPSTSATRTRGRLMRGPLPIFSTGVKGRGSGSWGAFSRCTWPPIYRTAAGQALGFHSKAAFCLYPDAVRLARHRASDADEPGALRPRAASLREQRVNAGAVIGRSNGAPHRHGCFNRRRSARSRHHRGDDVRLRPRRSRRRASPSKTTTRRRSAGGSGFTKKTVS